MDAPFQAMWAEIGRLQADLERLRTIEVPGGAPGFIQRVSGNGSLATLTLTVPAGYKHLQIKGRSKVTLGGAGFIPLWMRFNSDSSAAYTWRNSYDAAATTVVHANHGTIEVAQMECGQVTDQFGSPGTGADYASLDLQIIGASAVNLNRSIVFAGHLTYGTNQSTVSFRGTGRWNGAVAIVSITITNSLGTPFATGTFFDLYGWV